MSQVSWRRLSPIDHCSSFHSKKSCSTGGRKVHILLVSKKLCVENGLLLLFFWVFLTGVQLLNEMWITVWQQRYSVHRGHSIGDRGDEHRKENPGDSEIRETVPEFYVNCTPCFPHLWVCYFLGEEGVQKLDSSKPTESLQSFMLNY